MLGILLVIAVLFVVVMVRAVKVASGRGNARREVRRRERDAVDGAAGRADQAQTAGARHGRARGSVGAARRSDRRRPDLGPGRGRSRRHWCRRSIPRRDGFSSSAKAAPDGRFATALKPATALSDLIAEALEGSIADRPAHDHARRGKAAAPRCDRVADRRRRRSPAGRGLPVHRPDRRRRARRAAAAQGSAGAARRAHRRPRARIQERPRDHSRLRPAARSASRCPIRRARASKAFAPRRRRSAKWSRTFCASRGRSK